MKKMKQDEEAQDPNIDPKSKSGQAAGDQLEKLLADIRQQLKNARRVLVVSHIRPDGDAVGSLLGMGLSLQAAGKEVQMVLTDGVPGTFRFLTGSDKIVKRAEGSFDFSIVVDCSDLLRTGDSLNSIAGEEHQTDYDVNICEEHHTRPDLNIDHHVTNLKFAKYNLVEPDAVATSELLALRMPAMGLPLTAPVVDALMTGLITDTIGFRTNNMTARALRVAAELVDSGANLPELYQRSLSQHTYAEIRYWGCGLVNLQREGALVWSTMTVADRQSVGYAGRDDADLINLLVSLSDAEVALIFVEQNDGSVKVSWRSQNQKDVSSVALSFGGGGHRAASGAEIKGSLAEVQARVLEATRKLFETDKAGNPPLPS